MTNPENHIIRSWKNNTSPWIQAIRNAEIESRTSVTNQAIIDAILNNNPQNILDIGCGEGWLCRAMEERGITALGIDVVPELINEAKKHDSGKYRVMAYREITDNCKGECYDAIVCNFSLLGKESVEHVFASVKSLLNAKGVFMIQTIHPINGCGDKVYEDGWRAGSWTGFNDGFSDPPPWYFRTLESWKALFSKYEMEIKDIIEPLHPKTNTAASVIFIARSL